MADNTENVITRPQITAAQKIEAASSEDQNSEQTGEPRIQNEQEESVIVTEPDDKGDSCDNYVDNDDNDEDDGEDDEVDVEDGPKFKGNPESNDGQIKQDLRRHFQKIYRRIWGKKSEDASHTENKTQGERVDNGNIADDKSVTEGSSTFIPETLPTYNMNHKKRGILVIFNQQTFQPDLKLSRRKGSESDVINLWQTFTEFGFDVKYYTDLTALEIQRVLKKYAREDHTESDCFACAVLSHGQEYGYIWAHNDVVHLDKLTDQIKKCSSLVGKPKLFFIQACRGIDSDAGAMVQADGNTPQPKRHKIPIEADVLMAYSTTPGYVSYRRGNAGSWFINNLCHVVHNYGETEDIHRLMTRVNYRVAYNMETITGGMKQMTSMVSMLTKDLILGQKRDNKVKKSKGSGSC